MKMSEINILLELIGEFFPLVITQEKLIAWHEVLGHVDYKSARAALVKCLQQSDYSPRPSEVLKRIPTGAATTITAEESEFLEQLYRRQAESNHDRG
ncbi:hypothetical protein [Paenibacillus glucanolyticus]|uniref:hypothetical protein n=1 Tax=Paenibacillus glucanolyticus TaxID=59843 RepID=UPI00128DE304|nr:hypothetical protein [Paenibacillus glucanolyticus]MPY15818.1 hypothetical protein [Paenibacillus glucanolyticus]